MRPIRPIIALAIAAALLTGCEQNKTTPKASSPSPTASPSTPPRPSFETWIVYSQHDLQTSSEKSDVGTFRRRIPGGEPQKIDLRIGHKEFVSSPSGRFLAYDDGALWVARAEDFPKFRKVADPADRIYSIVWAPDGSRLFYNLGPVDETVKDPKERFHSIGFDGSGARQIATFPSTAQDNYSYRDLQGYDSSTDELVWNFGIADGAGGAYELYATNVTTGKTRSLSVSKGTVAYHAYALSPDAKRYYYVKDERTLVERTLADGKERTVYSAADGEQAIEFVNISADGSVVFFQGTAIPHLFSDGTTMGTTTTYKLDTASGSIDFVLSETGKDAEVLRIASLSPHGRHLWLTNYSPGGATVLLDTTSGSRTQIKPDASTGADSIHVVAWLSLEAS